MTKKYAVLPSLGQVKVAVIGLGYVGLPLALELAKHVDVLGFDVDEGRIQTLVNQEDTNGETEHDFLVQTSCRFTNVLEDIAACNIFIVTVPTPIDDHKQPDLTILKRASESFGALLKVGDIVVYESTVYPGVTEDICGPILERGSGLTCGVDFFLGYSPERINPGDKEHVLSNITKIVSGQTEDVADFLCELYGLINNDNIFKAKNIKTAEAAKAIENAQRDINVAFMNEITMALNKVDISVYDVLDAAKTKWNFLPFTPGLVGGHCIGVDPYYLAKFAQDHKHNPEMILAGRHINDGMGDYFAEQVDRDLGPNSKVLLLGFTFKENISDIRNTKVIDIVQKLEKLGHELYVHDPYADVALARKDYGVDVYNALPDRTDFDGIVLAVSHDQYLRMDGAEIEGFLKEGAGLVYDIKSVLGAHSFSSTVCYRCP